MNHNRTPIEIMGISLYLLSETLYQECLAERVRKKVSLLGVLESLACSSIKMDKRSPINTISLQNKVFGQKYQLGQGKRGKEGKKEVMKYLGHKDESDYRKFLATLFAY